MPTEENNSIQNLSLFDQDFVAIYTGEGTLTLEDARTVPCTFEAGQLRNSDVLLFCTSSTQDPLAMWMPMRSFNGKTSEGFNISSEGNIFNMDLRSRTESGAQVLYCLREITVQMTKNSTTRSIRFGVTNFIFDKPFSVHLGDKTSVVVVSVGPFKSQSSIRGSLRTLKTIDITCEVAVTLPLNGNIEQLEKVVDNFCYLLSVARGTKVQWIYRDQYGETGKLLSRNHSSRVTKPYCSLPIIGALGPCNDEETKRFVEETYNTYTTKSESYKLARIIDAYLDSKGGTDWLQLRGTKLAVAMETLKDVFLSLPEKENPVAEFVIKRSRFNDKFLPFIREKLLSLLEEKNFPITKEILGEKLQDINRRAFKDVLEDIFSRIGLQVNQEDKSSFIKSRNSLVHKGHFHNEKAALDEQEEKVLQEFFFLVNILDKVILKLLGYDGPYVDWRSLRMPILRKQI